MPFIVQCPYAGCGKYMLLEDGARGGRVECLLCKRSIAVEGSGSDEGRAATRPGATPPVRQPASGTTPRPAASGSPWSSPVEPTPSPAAPRSGGTPPPVRRETITPCPKCNAPLRLPPNAAGRSIRCPRCQNVFRAGG